LSMSFVASTHGSEGLAVREAPLGPYDLYVSEECFLTGTGTGAELIPVREIDGRPLGACPGPVFLTLRERFADLVVRETVRIGPGAPDEWA